MEHKNYHALVDVAVEAATAQSVQALSTLIQEGDRLYSMVDWDNWEESQHKVYGMFWGARLGGMTADALKTSCLWQIAVSIVGHTETAQEIARLVWNIEK